MSAVYDNPPGLIRPGFFTRFAAWWGPRPFAQAILSGLVLALLLAFAASISAQMTRVGITPGFGFLGRAANFEIGEGMIAYKAGDFYSRAILVGLLNTIKVAALGCIFATVIGVLFGVASLSGNLLLAWLVRCYVEIVRNTPLLLQLFFWIALAKSFPPPRQALSAFGSVFLSNRGVYIPGVLVDGVNAGFWVLAAAFLVLAGLAAWRWRRQGALTFLRLLGLAILLVPGVFVALAVTGASLSLETPQLAGFNIRSGYNLTPEFTALLVGLTVKFSAAIAEIVRAGILSVKQGQWEAARALGLRDGHIVRKVVLPQALRIITPLTTSSYLDLTKDSSLAVAIGYPDLVNIINTTANTTGQSFEALAILVGLYLVLNLSVSAAMNAYNKRVALRGGRPA